MFKRVKELVESSLKSLSNDAKLRELASTAWDYVDPPARAEGFAKVESSAEQPSSPPNFTITTKPALPRYSDLQIATAVSNQKSRSNKSIIEEQKNAVNQQEAVHKQGVKELVLAIESRNEAKRQAISEARRAPIVPRDEQLTWGRLWEYGKSLVSKSDGLGSHVANQAESIPTKLNTGEFGYDVKQVAKPGTTTFNDVQAELTKNLFTPARHEGLVEGRLTMIETEAAIHSLTKDVNSKEPPERLKFSQIYLAGAAAKDKKVNNIPLSREEVIALKTLDEARNLRDIRQGIKNPNLLANSLQNLALLDCGELRLAMTLGVSVLAWQAAAGGAPTAGTTTATTGGAATGATGAAGAQTAATATSTPTSTSAGSATSAPPTSPDSSDSASKLILPRNYIRSPTTSSPESTPPAATGASSTPTPPILKHTANVPLEFLKTVGLLSPKPKLYDVFRLGGVVPLGILEWGWSQVAMEGGKRYGEEASITLAAAQEIDDGTVTALNSALLHDHQNEIVGLKNTSDPKLADAEKIFEKYGLEAFSEYNTLRNTIAQTPDYQWNPYVQKATAPMYGRARAQITSSGIAPEYPSSHGIGGRGKIADWLRQGVVKEIGNLKQEELSAN